MANASITNAYSFIIGFKENEPLFSPPHTFSVASLGERGNFPFPSKEVVRIDDKHYFYYDASLHKPRDPRRAKSSDKLDKQKFLNMLKVEDELRKEKESHPATEELRKVKETYPEVAYIYRVRPEYKADLIYNTFFGQKGNLIESEQG